jgi:hypothetical protein
MTHVQTMVLVVRMATVLEECTKDEELSVVRFLWAKELTARDIGEEMFHVYAGKCLSRKAVHNWVENVSLMTKSLKRRNGSG